MAEYLGKVYLGGLYKNGSILKRPLKPWKTEFGNGGIGDIYTSGTMAEYMIGDTPLRQEEQLVWHKFRDGIKTILICDRNIVSNISWQDLNVQNLITGKDIKIDNKSYKIRLLTGGNDYRPESRFLGAIPVNEWDRIIANEDRITGIPIPTSSDLNMIKDDYDRTSPHNQFWNWANCYSWAQEIYKGSPSHSTLRGCTSANFYNADIGNKLNVDYGWRPVLEIPNNAPIISGEDRDLGDKNKNFTITYTINDADDSDILTVVESFDGIGINTISNAVKNQVYTINVEINKFTLGNHTIVIQVNDGKGGIAYRTFTFRRINTVPIISGTNSDLGDKNNEFQIKYYIEDSDQDDVIVTEKLNNEVLRTIKNPPNKQELVLSINKEQLYKLAVNSINTITIEANDGKGGLAYRTHTFKRSNTVPIINISDEDLGVMKTPFSKNYIVNDFEGDKVIVTEKINSEIIRTYEAVLGKEESIKISDDIWKRLQNGKHNLIIELTDVNQGRTVRTIKFEKFETEIKFELLKPFDADAKVGKILVTPTWEITGAVVKVEACNNAYDETPTWEDITPQVLINRIYNFTNATKKATKWGVNIRFTITRKEGYIGEINISGFGGAFE